MTTSFLTDEEVREARVLLSKLLPQADLPADSPRWRLPPSRVRLLVGLLATLPFIPAQTPAPLHLTCPACGTTHEDILEEDGTDWRTRRHHRHLCNACGNVWEPFSFYTVGAAHPHSVRLRELVAVAERFGWNGVENPKNLADHLENELAASARVPDLEARIQDLERQLTAARASDIAGRERLVAAERDLAQARTTFLSGTPPDEEQP